LVRAPELKNADILANVSRQRIEVNSASSERTSDKDLKYIENLQQVIWTAFLNKALDKIIFGSKLGQKGFWPSLEPFGAFQFLGFSKTSKLDGKTFFAKRWLVNVDKKFLNLFFVLLLQPNTGVPGIYTWIIELTSPFLQKALIEKNYLGWTKRPKFLLEFFSLQNLHNFGDIK
jgi:hypothetical protein